MTAFILVAEHNNILNGASLLLEILVQVPLVRLHRQLGDEYRALAPGEIGRLLLLQGLGPFRGSSVTIAISIPIAIAVTGAGAGAGAVTLP